MARGQTNPDARIPFPLRRRRATQGQRHRARTELVTQALLVALFRAPWAPRTTAISRSCFRPPPWRPPRSPSAGPCHGPLSAGGPGRAAQRGGAARSPSGCFGSGRLLLLGLALAAAFLTALDPDGVPPGAHCSDTRGNRAGGRGHPCQRRRAGTPRGPALELPLCHPQRGDGGSLRSRFIRCSASTVPWRQWPSAPGRCWPCSCRAWCASSPGARSSEPIPGGRPAIRPPPGDGRPRWPSSSFRAPSSPWRWRARPAASQPARPSP